MSFPIDEAIARLEKEVREFDVPIVDLIAAQTKDPFKVLVATILSARTKDEVTAEAARRVFARAETPEALAKLTVAELEKLVFPVGFFRNKAKHLSELPKALFERFVRTHVAEPVPFLIWHPGITPDEVQQFDEVSAVSGSYGLLRLNEFIHCFMAMKQ